MLLKHLFVALGFFLPICAGEVSEQLYIRIPSLDDLVSANATYHTFSASTKLRCLSKCNSDTHCKGVFYDGHICSFASRDAELSALSPSPKTRFYIKSKYNRMCMIGMIVSLCYPILLSHGLT